MSLQNHIKSLFKMQDILFLEEAFSTIEKKGVIYQLWNAISTTSVSICPHCRGIHLVRNGTYQKKILLSKCFGYPILLLVKQQRYLCRDCNKTKSAELQGVEKYCNISLNLKLAILFALQQKQSMTAIAKEYGVSVTTVQRFLDTCYQQEYIPRELPEVLCIDEFSSTKDSSDSMSCTLLNGETHEIVDILENRQLSFLEECFGSFSYEERKRVKYLVMDMYSPYMTLARKLFPSAEIVLDRFHIVQLIHRAFNQTRIQCMNTFRKINVSIYSRLKRFWKEFLQDSSNLSYQKYYCRSFRCLISARERVEKLLKGDRVLEESYWIYQNILYAIKKKRYSLFLKILEQRKEVSSLKIKKSLQTLYRYRREIKTSLSVEYSNAALEGKHLVIKEIKRISYGYRKFRNLRKRIFIIQGLLKINPNFC